jgi:branched-chain amino acid transport system ATP-binding protein
LANNLIVHNVIAGYGAVRVLHSVSLSLGEGETVVLLGANGNGKSTLMKCIMGMVRPDSGEIYLESDDKRVDLTDKHSEEIVNLGISLIPEGKMLFPFFTVRENLVVGAYRTEARNELEKNLKFSYEFFPILEERKSQLAGTLSGGEQQMLAIARALMSSPKIILVDEPSLGLAPIFVGHVIDKIKELKEQFKLTVLMAEQNFTRAVKIADRGYIIVEGKIEFEGKNKKELSENELVKKFYLGV